MLGTVNEIEELRRQARKINQRLNAIRDAERFAENKELVGKTFRYRNNYSVPEKPSDYWWLYAKVQKVDKSGYLTVFQFQTDKYGRVEIRTEKHMFHLTDGYQPITTRQFDKAWRSLKGRISDARP